MGAFSTIDWSKVVQPLLPRSNRDDGPTPPRVPVAPLPMPAFAQPQTDAANAIPALPPITPAPMPKPASEVSAVPSIRIAPFPSTGQNGSGRDSVIDLPPIIPMASPTAQSVVSTYQPHFMQQLGADEQRAQYLRNSGSGISQIGETVDPTTGVKTSAHPGFWKSFGKVAATVGDDLLSVTVPGIAALTPSTTAHNQLLQRNAQGAIASDFSDLQSQATLADSQAQAAQRQGLAVQEQAKAQALLNPKPSKGQLLYDGNKSPIGYISGEGQFMGMDDPNLPAGVGDILKAAQRKQPTNPFELWEQQNPKGTAEDYIKLSGEGKIVPIAEQYNQALQSGDVAGAQRLLKVIHDTSTQPKIDVHAANERPTATPSQMVYVPQGDGSTKAVNVVPGTVIPSNASKTPGGTRIDADEQKRADFAQNMNENINQLEDILTRRPDLFGPVAGRVTQLKNMVGTSDTDASTLMTLEHQLGMVAQSAHGMRSSQGVVKTAQSLTNSFHNSPEATRAALEAARSSVRTFLGDSQQPGQPRSAGSANADPLGIR